MHTGSILRKAAGEVIPAELLKKTIEANGSIVGALVAKDGKFDIMGGPAANAEEYLKQVEQLQTTYHADDVWFFFGKNATGFSDESQQPFFLVTENKVDEVVCFLDGNFEQFGEPKSVHSNEFFFAQKQMAPHMSALFQLAGKDSKKLFEVLKDPVHGKTYLNQAGQRAVIVLLNRHGDRLIWEKGTNISGHRKWGYASNLYGYADNTSALAPVETPATMPQRRRAIDTDTKVAATPPAETSSKSTVREPYVAHAPDSKVERKVIERMEQPPKEYWGNKDKAKAWYRLTIPKNKPLPDDYLSKTNPPAIMVRITVDADKYQAMMASTAVEAPPVAPATTEPEREVVEQPKNEPTTVEGKLPLIPASMVKTIREKFLNDPTIAKIIDDNGVQITSPKELQAIERKHPTFAEAMGLAGLEATFKWSFEDRVKLCTQWPRAAAVLMQDYLFAYADLLAEQEGGEGTVAQPEKAPAVEIPKAPAQAAMPARRRAV